MKPRSPDVRHITLKFDSDDHLLLRQIAAADDVSKADICNRILLPAIRQEAARRGIKPATPAVVS